MKRNVVTESGYSRAPGTVRILTSPEELAAAIARAEEFERRNAETIASRAQRHEAALARSPSPSKETPWSRSHPMATPEERSPAPPPRT
jgi:hypothetical protein